MTTPECTEEAPCHADGCPFCDPAGFLEAEEQPPTANPEIEPDDPDALLPDAFWSARPYLKHIRDAAHSRQRSAPAVLGVVLARTAAMVHHRLRIPAIVGSSAGLSLITAVLAPPGVGKSTANDIGTDVLPVPEGSDVVDQVPIGTGEGMVELFFDMVEEESDGKKVKVKRQTRHNAFFYVDEGQVLTEIGTRKNATLLPTIRSAFTGSTLGQMNASEERRRVLPAGQYAIGMVVAMQTVLAGGLLDDAAGGTPQRLIWLPAIDPTIPDEPPDWPGSLPWTPPGYDEMRRIGASLYGPADLVVTDAIRDEVRAEDRARARGELVVDELEAHGTLLRLKLAALLAILDGRLHIGDEDWHLAKLIKNASDATRTDVVKAVKIDAAKQEEKFRKKLGARAAATDAAVGESRVLTAAAKVADKVRDEPDRWTFAELRRGMPRWRDVFPEAIERAVSEGWVTEVPMPGQGGGKRALRPGSG